MNILNGVGVYEWWYRKRFSGSVRWRCGITATGRSARPARGVNSKMDNAWLVMRLKQQGYGYIAIASRIAQTFQRSFTRSSSAR